MKIAVLSLQLVRVSVSPYIFNACVACCHLIGSHTQIVLTSTKKLDNVIFVPGRVIGEELYCKGTGVIKTDRNIRIYCPQVFSVRSGPNQLYSLQYGLECLSPYYKRR